MKNRGVPDGLKIVPEERRGIRSSLKIVQEETVGAPGVDKEDIERSSKMQRGFEKLFELMKYICIESPRLLKMNTKKKPNNITDFTIFGHFFNPYLIDYSYNLFNCSLANCSTTTPPWCTIEEVMEVNNGKKEADRG